MMRLLLLVVMVSVPWSRQAEIPADKHLGMYGPAPDTNAKANNFLTINDVDPQLVESLFKPFSNTINENEAATTNNGNREAINNVFNIPITTNNAPTNNAPTNNGPTNNGPTNNGPTNNGPTNNGPTNNGPTNNGPTNNGPTNNGPTNNWQMNGPTPTTTTQANNNPTINGIDPAVVQNLFGGPPNNGQMNGPTPATTTQANNNPTINGIAKAEIDKIFNPTGGPPNNNPTIAPILSTSGDHPTTTIVTYSDTCQCVTYSLCNQQKEGVDVYNSNKTGNMIIDQRFSEEYCEDSMDVCCKIPMLLTATIAPKPPAKKPKGCGYRNPNGIEVFHTNTAASTSQFGEFPWVVALMNSFKNSYIGAGVLIHPQVVLTAAHVVSLSAPGDIKIRAGEWDTKTVREPFPHEERQVKMIHIHPGHNKEVNDVAMLQFETPLELTEHINTICLSDQGEVLDTAKNCIANGWGKDRFGSDVPFSVILKKLELDMMDHSHCNSVLRYTGLGPQYKLHNSVICAGGEEGKDMCSGDGGGPLACPIGNNRYKLAGLVVGGIGCGKKGIPGLYLSLPATRSWVDEKMNALGYGISAYTI